MNRSFTDTTCTTVAAYSAVVTDTCFFNGKVTCGSKCIRHPCSDKFTAIVLYMYICTILGTITYTEYAEDGCMGAVTDTDSDATNVCLLTATQDDNDANTGSEYYSCSGAGASFLLDARVIAGLVIGGISLLAL